MFDHWTHQGACLLSQRLQLLGPAFGPLSFVTDGIERIRGPHRTDGDCGKESDCSFHRDSPKRLGFNAQIVDEQETNCARVCFTFSAAEARETEIRVAGLLKHIVRVECAETLLLRPMPMSLADAADSLDC